MNSEENASQDPSHLIEINRSAPAVVSDEIDVEAPPEVVWEVMADIAQWPQWNPDISWVKLSGDLSPGTVFRWKSGPGTITSTLRFVEPPSVLAWTGRTLGINAIHIWRIEARDGGSVVATEESWDGLPVRIFRGMMQKALNQAIEKGLEYLKAEAERRSR